jgi:putative PIN family toxin of toxin-antitoxin system
VKGAPRTVLDTNVVVSALVFREGRVAPLRVAWQEGRFRPIVSRATTEELLRVLSYPKFGLSADDRIDLLSDYLPFCRVVTIPARMPKVPACPDPDDRAFLQLARAGKASWLVTGDADLLGIAPSFGCRIVRPGTFLEAIGEGS